MANFAFAIDITRCSGCGSCFLACKDEYIGNDRKPYSVAQPGHGHKWLRLNEIEQGEGSKVKLEYIPVLCQHCENPPCANGAPEGAVYKKDGAVILDPEKSKGLVDIVGKCPYGAIFWNEESKTPQKCNMCMHMLDSGETTTRCAESCPTKALMFGDLDDPDSEIAKYVAERGDFTSFKPEFDAKPCVLYRQLPAPFITGEVTADGECLEGAAVTCTGGGITLTATTDFMGDFQFRALVKGTKYKICVSSEGYAGFEAELVIHSARDIGTIVLKRV